MNRSRPCSPCTRILLLDDDSNDALLFEAMVAQKMEPLAELKWCKTADEADAWLADHKTDICLIDYNLNGAINGLQWAQNRHQQQGVMGPALLILTGETDITTIDALAGGDDSGISDFLVKQELTAPLLERAIRYATKQQRLLQEMKLREMRARLFFDYAREGIVTLDSKGRITQANPAADKLFGYAEGTMTGLFLSQLIPGFSMNLFRPMGSDARPLMSSSTIHQVVDYNLNGTMLSLEMSLGIVHSDEESFYAASFLDVSGHLNAVERMRQQAQTDDLTGLMNRRHFRQKADAEMRRAARHHHPMAVMMLDIDFFKQVNDTLGHAAGDAVLRKVAAQLRETMRDQDLICRWGGEEFLVLLPDSDVEGARILAERVRENIASLAFDSLPNGITISIGIAKVDPHQQLKVATNAADQALYRAKKQGRNRVCCASTPDD